MGTKDHKAGMAAGARPFAEKEDRLGKKVDESAAKNEAGNLKIEQTMDAIFEELERRDRAQSLGLNEQVGFGDLEDEEAIFLISALYKLANEKDCLSSEQQFFVASLKQTLGAVEVRDDISLEAVENITDVDAQKLMLGIVLEYIYLGGNKWGFTETEREFIECFQVNSKTVSSLKMRIEQEERAIGPSGIAHKYEYILAIDDFADEAKVNEVSQEKPDNDIDGREPNFVNADSEQAKEDYHEVKHMVYSRLINIFPSEGGKSKQNSQEKRQQQFKEKYTPYVVDKTIIALAEANTVKILFTTCGMHILEFLSKKPKFIKYSSLNMALAKINYSHKKDKGAESLTLVTVSAPGNTEELKIDSVGIDYSLLFDLLNDVRKVPVAVRDASNSLAFMPEAAKVLFGKILILFCRQCHFEDADIIEAIRFVNDLKPCGNDLRALLNYADDDNADDDTSRLLAEFMTMVPYPSEENVKYELVQSLVALIQYISGRPRDLTGAERGSIVKIAQELDINNDLLEKVIQKAQVDYRIIIGDIDKKEIGAIGQAVTTTAMGVGVPVATVFGANALFWNVLWFNFIPGIGTVLATGALGVAAAAAIIKNLNRDGNELEQAREGLVKRLKTSYSQLRINVGRVMDGTTAKDKWLGRIETAEKSTMCL